MRVSYTKIWQTIDYKLVLQIRVSEHIGESLPTKLFLVLDVEQRSFGWRFQTEKPANLNPNHAFIGRLRKNAKSGAILEFRRFGKEGYFLKLASGGRLWGLRLRYDTPPFFDFVELDSKTSLMRWGQRGTFTKKQQYFDEESTGEDLFCELETAARALATKDELEEESETCEQTQLSSEQKQIRSRLRRKLKTLGKSYLREEQNLPSAAELVELQRSADLLKQYSYLVRPEEHELTLGREYTGLDEKLTIDCDKNIGQNIEDLYARLKKRRRARSLGLKRLEKLRCECRELEAAITRLGDSQLSSAGLLELVQRYRLSLRTDKAAAPSLDIQRKPYKTYRLPSGWVIFLGRSPKENDLLTKRAKGNDTWVHTTAVPGAHAIIPRNGQPQKSSPPPEVVRAAAILSIHASRLRRDLGGEVYVTEKNNIRKKKGLPDGLWLVERCETLYVRYAEQELKELLNHLSKD